MTDAFNPGLDIVRPTPEHRYENAHIQFTSLTSPRFRTPRVSAATADRLKEVLNNRPFMSKGENSGAVKAVQQALIDLQDVRITIPDGATGFFGDQTLEAVRAFQKAHKLVSQNAVVGAETLGKLDALYAHDPKPARAIEQNSVIAPRAWNIPRIQQPKGAGSCWATAATMMYFWKMNPSDVPPPGNNTTDRVDTWVRWVLQRTRSRTDYWLQTYEVNNGLNSGENHAFYGDGLGMRTGFSVPDADLFKIPFWTGMLSRGPVAVNTFRWVSPFKGRNHVIVIYGIKRMDSGGTLMYVDPFDGRDHEAPLAFILAAMGFQSNSAGWETPPTVQYRDRVIFW